MQLTHVPLIVKNQEEALDFFIKKFGFEKKEDRLIGQERWLTVGPVGASLQMIIQMPHEGPDKAFAKQREAIIGNQSFWFTSQNVQKERDTLVKNNVTILENPVKYTWGKQLVCFDLYGNTHVLVEPM